MQRTVQSIFQHHFPTYGDTLDLPGHHFRAANAIIACRTAKLGGHVQTCVNGHLLGVWYNSCRHRRCPQCNFSQVDQWLDKQKARLLNSPHRHIVFTIPHQLLPLWRYNTALMIDCLFKAARDTLMELCLDEKYLGAMPGFISALHTWGRSLSLHPHIHCLVTEGGLGEDGVWRTPRRNSFLPARVTMALFRGKLLDYVKNLAQSGVLKLPPDHSITRTENLLNKLGRIKWNVRIMERYAHGRGVATYLARYVRGGPISNKQLRENGHGNVVLRYRAHDDGDREIRSLTVTPEHFVARYLEHVPPIGKQVVRNYGIYASTAREALDTSRARFDQNPVRDDPEIETDVNPERVSPERVPRCPHCNEPILLSTSVVPVTAWRPPRGLPVSVNPPMVMQS